VEIKTEVKNPNKATISMLEKQHRCPVVRSVLLEPAGCASRELGEIIVRVHGYVESGN